MLLLALRVTVVLYAVRLVAAFMATGAVTGVMAGAGMAAIFITAAFMAACITHGWVLGLDFYLMAIIHFIGAVTRTTIATAFTTNIITTSIP
jgi:hypothetical protein